MVVLFSKLASKLLKFWEILERLGCNYESRYLESILDESVKFYFLFNESLLKDLELSSFSFYLSKSFHSFNLRLNSSYFYSISTYLKLYMKLIF